MVPKILEEPVENTVGKEDWLQMRFPSPKEDGSFLQEEEPLTVAEQGRCKMKPRRTDPQRRSK